MIGAHLWWCAVSTRHFACYSTTDCASVLDTYHDMTSFGHRRQACSRCAVLLSPAAAVIDDGFRDKQKRTTSQQTGCVSEGCMSTVSCRYLQCTLTLINLSAPVAANFLFLLHQRRSPLVSCCRDKVFFVFNKPPSLDVRCHRSWKISAAHARINKYTLIHQNGSIIKRKKEKQTLRQGYS
jgi:hypothetical protein